MRKLDIELQKQKRLSQLKLDTLIKEKKLQLHDDNLSEYSIDNEHKQSLNTEKYYIDSDVSSERLVEEWIKKCFITCFATTRG